MILLPVFGILLAACSNDFEVAAPWKEIPVVYAILSAKDTANYIRIEKAFLDPEQSALNIAQIADSIYYPENEIAVYLERPSVSAREQLHRVDGNLEGFPREDGVFASQPNWLYKLNTPPNAGLRPGEKYRLVIERADGKPDVTAETTIPNNFTFSIPLPAASPPIINFTTGTTSEVRWKGDVNSTFFSILMTIRYQIQAPNGTILAHHTINWPVTPNVKRGNIPTNTTQGLFYTSSYEISGDAFFQMLHDSIPAVEANDTNLPDLVYRYFELSSITLEGGGSEIDTYLQTASANSGITGSEIITTYSNLSEGFGIFTAKNTSSLNGIKIQQKTVDSMNDNPVTKALNFRI